MRLELVIYGHAAPAGSKTVGRTKTGSTFVRDSSGHKGTTWRRQLKDRAGETMNGNQLMEGPLALRATFYMPRPKAHYGAKGIKPSAPTHPVTRPDCGKLLRAVEDALTGIVYRDDSQIVSQKAWKRYGEPARLELVIHHLTDGHNPVNQEGA